MTTQENNLPKKKENDEAVLSLIAEVQSLVQTALARVNVYHAAACPPEYSGHKVDCQDLYLVLGDHKKHLKHIAKVVEQLEFKYLDDHYDRKTGGIK